MSAADLVRLENFSNIFSLRGKVAVVTGGSRGLGLHAASGFIQSGCSKVYLIARTESDVKVAAAALNNLDAPGKEQDAQAIPIVGDISKPGECERVAAEIAKTTDHVDILLANAGATYIAPFDEYTEDDFARVMNVNVNSVFFSIQKFTPLLAAGGTVNDPSRVLMVSSVAGVVIGDVGPYGTYAYAASKAAVVHLMQNLAVELGPRHITVNVVAPGIVPSKMSASLMDRHGGLEEVAKQVPDQKLGAPEDIAGVMVFLSSRAGKHINGATIVLDGGSFLVRGCA
ncbi:gluconate 5-dehydrogenase [Aspergillus heterothallicus]